jgi:cell division septation protein DedD
VTRDYKHVRHDPPRPLPGWVWLLTGLTIGLAVALMVYLNQPNVASIGPQTAINDPPTACAKGVGEQANKTATKERRHFDFYTLLPELEVVVPENQSRPSSTASAASSTSAATGPYILQAGSFRRAEEADTLKANLALLGVEADIQKVTVDNNMWHRVRIGPYANLDELNRMREKLARNRIDTVVLKERR